MNKNPNEFRADCGFYGKPRCKHYKECNQTYADCAKWADSDYADESKKIKANCATEDYINRGEVMEAILGEPPEAHYPAWYAAKIASLQSIRIRPLKRWINKILESRAKKSENVVWDAGKAGKTAMEEIILLMAQLHKANPDAYCDACRMCEYCRQGRFCGNGVQKDVCRPAVRKLIKAKMLKED